MNSKFSFYYKAPSELTTESIALFARMTVQPSQKQKNVINDTIKALKNAGIWDLLDVFVMFHSHDVQAAYLNWKANTYNAVPVNSPTFAAFSGIFIGNTKYIHTNFTPGLTSMYKLNDASLSIKTNTDVISSSYDIVRSTTGAGITFIRRNYTNEFACCINAQSGSAIQIKTSVLAEANTGLFVVDLKNNYAKLFKNGIKRKEENYIPFDVPKSYFVLGQNNPSNYQFYHVGASLTEQQQTDLNMIINNYIASYHA